MGDIFNDNIDLTAGGAESTLTGAPAEEQPTQGASAGQQDSTAAQAAGQPTDTEHAPDQGQPAAGTEQASTSAPQPEDEVAKLEQEAEAALANERTPPWFKNTVDKVYKPKLEKLGKELEQYSAFGTPEEVQKAVSMRQALAEVRSDPQTGMPVRSTENFVKTLHAEDPQAAYSLITDLATLPSPITQGLTVTQELLKGMGIDPNRLPELQQFAANGYSLTASAFPAPDPEDLAQMPQHLQATFAKLDPETRSSLMGDNDAVRNNNLEAHRVRQQTEEQNKGWQEQKDEQDRQQQEQAQAQFKSQVDAKGIENFTASSEAVLNSFVDSLAKQAGFSKMDSLMVVNTVLNSLTPTLEGRLSVEALKAEGIEVDPAVPQIINKLEELSKHAAYYQLTNDQRSLQAVAADISGLQEKLIAKGNKIVAALALKRNQARLAPANQQNQQLSATQTSRHAIAGVGTQVNYQNGGKPMDFSDESYEEDLRGSGFGPHR